MTPITINLLTEEHRAQHASARDPVKIAVVVGIVLVASVLAAGAWVQMAVEQKKTDLNRLQDEQRKVMATQTKGGDGFSAKALAEDVVAINQSRLLYGPELAMVKDLIPDGIQLTSLRYALVKDTSQPEPPPAEDKPREKPSKRRAASKSAEYLVLQLDGKAIGGQPEQMVDSFIKALNESAAFKAKVKEIQLKSIARVVVATTESSGAGGNSAMFVIECRYKNRP
jgi:Na+-transporting NADH:ubiquinone oxidoreductase subunit NqrC